MWEGKDIIQVDCVRDHRSKWYTVVSDLPDVERNAAGYVGGPSVYNMYRLKVQDPFHEPAS